METLITYMFQLTLAFIVIQVCIPLLIIFKERNKPKTYSDYADLNQVKFDEAEHQHFLQEIDSILNINHISHCDD
jgi:hypothetical protein